MQKIKTQMLSYKNMKSTKLKYWGRKRKTRKGNALYVCYCYCYVYVIGNVKCRVKLLNVEQIIRNKCGRNLFSVYFVAFLY